jgi:hypothetical protein
MVYMVPNADSVDLVKHYTKEVFKYSLWTFGWSAKTWFANTSNTFPAKDFIKIEPKDLKKWDIVFWDWWKYSKYWHTWIVLENRWKTILCLDQNNGTWTWTGKENAVREFEYDFTNIVWWYRYKFYFYEYKWVPVYHEEVNKANKLIRWMFIPKAYKWPYIVLYNQAFVFNKKYWDIDTQIKSRLEHEYSHYIYFEKLTDKQRKAWEEISKYSDRVKNDTRNSVIPYKDNAFIKDVCKEFVSEDFAYIWEEYIYNPNKVYWNYLDYKKKAVITLMKKYD